SRSSPGRRIRFSEPLADMMNSSADPPHSGPKTTSCWSMYAGRLWSFALIYFLAHKIGFLFPESSGGFAAVWPASGIALAMLLLNPRRLWPAIIVVAFVVGLAATLGMGLVQGPALVV